MTEAQIQAKIFANLEKKGYLVLRLAAMTKAGLPDLLALKNDEVYFVEVKNPNGKLSKLQEFKIKQLKKLGFKVDVLTIKDKEITKF